MQAIFGHDAGDTYFVAKTPSYAYIILKVSSFAADFIIKLGFGGFGNIESLSWSVAMILSGK